MKPESLPAVPTISSQMDPGSVPTLDRGVR